jgi:hypothetical protein
MNCCGNKISRVLMITWMIISLALAACTPLPDTQPASQTVLAPREATSTVTIIPTASSLPVATETPAPVPTTKVATVTTTPTITPSPLPTSTATATPTYAILRGKVIERSNCRYGPGAAYLYYVGLRVGTTMEVIGRNDLGTWVLIQGVGDDRSCWIKASLMEIDGDVMRVAPTYKPLPLSPYYRPPTGAYATRDGDNLTLHWHGFRLRPGDETASAPFLVEAWICVEGQVYFTPVGVYGTSLTLTDEAGCQEPSRALLYIVEKHGYTRGVEIELPPHPKQ